MFILIVSLEVWVEGIVVKEVKEVVEKGKLLVKSIGYVEN